MRVLIVGGGIGGLTAALAILHRRPDARVTVLERAEEIAELGAGLQLSSNGVRILQRLGLSQSLQATAFRPEAVELRDAASTRLLFRTALGQAAEERWGAPYWHLHRADLQAGLLNALDGLDGASFRLGAAVESLDPGDPERPARVRLAGGEEIEAELVVGADGWRSVVRAALFDDGQPRFTGQVAWRGLVPAERLPAGLVPPVASVWTGPGRHFVHYYVRGGALVNFVGVVEGEAAPESWREPGDPAVLAAAFAGWPPVVQSLIAAAPEVLRWGLYDREPMAEWSKGRAALLGDAAHPMPPFLAQGAVMAIEDAWALSRRLVSAGPVGEALKAYAAERWPRTARVLGEARRNGVLFHLPGLLRRPLFGLAGRLDSTSGMGRLDWLYGYDA